MIYIYSLNKEPLVIEGMPRQVSYDTKEDACDEGVSRDESFKREDVWTLAQIQEVAKTILLQMRDSGELLDYDDDSIGIRLETCPRCVGDQCNNSKGDIYFGKPDGGGYPDYNDQDEYNNLYTLPGTCAYKIDMQELYSKDASWVIDGIPEEVKDMLYVNNHVYLIGRKRDEDRSYNPYKDSGGRFYFNKTIRRYIDGKHEKLMDELFVLYEDLQGWAEENNGSVYDPPDYIQEAIDNITSQFDFMEDYHYLRSFPMPGQTFAEAMSIIPYEYDISMLLGVDDDPRIMRPYETDEGETIIEDAKVIAIIK